MGRWGVRVIATYIIVSFSWHFMWFKANPCRCFTFYFDFLGRGVHLSCTQLSHPDVWILKQLQREPCFSAICCLCVARGSDPAQVFIVASCHSGWFFPTSFLFASSWSQPQHLSEKTPPGVSKKPV